MKAFFVTVLAVITGVATSPCDAQLRVIHPHFVAGSNTSTSLDVILKYLDKRHILNRDYNLSFVPCGTGCGSYWLVNRQTGEVFSTPDNARHPDEEVWDVRGRQDSDQIAVFYGPGDGTSESCTVETFKLVAHRFDRLTFKQSVACPQ